MNCFCGNNKTLALINNRPHEWINPHPKNAVFLPVETQPDPGLRPERSFEGIFGQKSAKNPWSIIVGTLTLVLYMYEWLRQLQDSLEWFHGNSNALFPVEKG